MCRHIHSNCVFTVKINHCRWKTNCSKETLPENVVQCVLPKIFQEDFKKDIWQQLKFLI